MVKLILCVASLLALGQTAAAAKAVTSFSEWVDGIIADPTGDNMTPGEVVDAFKSGNFTTPPAGTYGRSVLQKRASCYEQPNTECLIVDAVACINAVARRGANDCHGVYMQCQINTAAMTTDGNTDSSCNDVARGGGFILDHCVRSGNDWVEGSEFAFGNGGELVRLRRP
ncbi:hypothetical protein BCR34DRAFT_631010 [Clohesyomyces aquaticus]|uniref:Uncharacterized protein n=1 Tax=Clohesyomyces aquaticus TaxID=1231657 RepID=A0A1Y1ZBJ6_9PLEO|nr:hypothetical protein BCR34DRAFT_631010 [Clohesyomyces aquaticus]